MNIGTLNNLAKGILQIIFINIIFLFLSAKNEFFCEVSTENMIPNGTQLFFTKSGAHIMDDPQYEFFLNSI